MSSRHSIIITDPVYGEISLQHAVVKQAIDTPYLQRLRDLYQTGPVVYIYPGATHTRFQHSLCAAYITKKTIDALNRNSNSGSKHKKVISETYERYITIAALWHDVGHGPTSHNFEELLHRMGIDWTHERQAEELVKRSVDMLNENLAENRKITAKHTKFMLDCINGNTPDSKLPSFYGDIVNSSKHPDADRMAYIPVDCKYTGMTYACKPDIVLRGIKVINNQIVYPIKHFNPLDQIATTRFRLFNDVYFHEGVSAAKEIQLDAMSAAADTLHIRDRLGADDFLYLTDHIFHEIRMSNNVEAKRILDRLTVNRNLYKCCGTWLLPGAIWKRLSTEGMLRDLAEGSAEYSMPGHFSKLPIAAREKIAIQLSNLSGVPAGLISVELFNTHYGRKENDPLGEVLFYDRNREAPYHVDRANVHGNITPATFCQYNIRAYYKGTSTEQHDCLRRGLAKFVSGVVGGVGVGVGNVEDVNHQESHQITSSKKEKLPTSHSASNIEMAINDVLRGRYGTKIY